MQNKLLQNKPDLKTTAKDKYFIAYSNILCNNPLFKAKLFEYFDYDIEKVFLVTKDDLKNFAEIYPHVSIPKSFLKNIYDIDTDKIYQKLSDNGTKYITYDNENYPERLKTIEDFPTVLFYKGSLNNINFDKTIAIVGSRNSTEQAKVNVLNIVSGFKNTDITIVSGLAAGIDTASHKAAIDNNLKTVAVIGSGLNFQYPAANKYLYKKIEEENGVIFSEYPDDLPPAPQNFPQRNRIVTALSKGVIIAEARIKSGAMISAKFALEQGRELMCIPGLISNPNCEGIYYLIKQGAGIVTNSDDVLSILNWEVKPQKSLKLNLDGLKKQIYDLISCEEISIEGLNIKLDVGINELMMKLTEMELDGLIIQKNGLYYTLGN